jgi:hypothetical protein
MLGMGYFPAPGSIDNMPRLIGTIIDGQYAARSNRPLFPAITMNASPPRAELHDSFLSDQALDLLLISNKSKSS